MKRYDILREISANMLYLFKIKKEDMVVVGNWGQLVELVYPIYEDEY